MTARSLQYRCARRVCVALLALASLSNPAVTRGAVLPTLPQVLLDTTPPSSAGALIAVGAGGNFQAALNAAQPGDTITLEAGAVYSGSFTLPVKTGAGWITIRTSAPDSSLPPYGQRITPAYANVLPKLVTPDTSPALMTAPGAHHYRVVGVEITLASSVPMHYGLVAIGDGSRAQNTLAVVPSAITFDRVYIHGNATANLVRGISLNGTSVAVVNSYLSEIHYAGLDSQALAGWNGPGPFKIVNNYLEASGENIMFGGADPSIPNLVPSDIEVRGNHLYKPLAWRQTAWTVKNLFELKNARRVLIDGNIFENVWAQAQSGFAILFTVRNQDGTAPWSTVSDITFTHNVVRHAGSAINVLGMDDIRSSQRAQRLLIQHNLFEDVSRATWGGSGRAWQLLNGAESVTIDHNTAFQSHEFVLASQAPQVAFTFTNNLVLNNEYGLIGDGCIGNGCLASFLPGAVIQRNGIIGGNAGTYPEDNVFPVSVEAVLFTNRSGGDYQLSGASPYRNGGTDGRDLGVDWPALTTAISGVVSGRAPGAAGPPVDMTAPSVAVTVANLPPPLVLTAPSVSSVTPTGAVIEWSTSVPADTQVQYGITPDYGSVSPLSAMLVTAHTVGVAGLTPSTLYHVRALSLGASGEQVASPDATFTTPAPAPGATDAGTPERWRDRPWLPATGN